MTWQPILHFYSWQKKFCFQLTARFMGSKVLQKSHLPRNNFWLVCVKWHQLWHKCCKQIIFGAFMSGDENLWRDLKIRIPLNFTTYETSVSAWSSKIVNWLCKIVKGTTEQHSQIYENCKQMKTSAQLQGAQLVPIWGTVLLNTC